MTVAPPFPAGFTLLASEGRTDFGHGNLVFRCPDAEGGGILKIYQRRDSVLRDLQGNFSQRWIERKRGVSAGLRCQTEREVLEAWARAGFDAPKRLRRPLPDWVGDRPALIMEDVPGPTLRDVLADPEPPRAEKETLVAALAGAMAARHRTATDVAEPLLIQEHASTGHVLVCEERLVTIDFEHAYQPGFPVAVAIAFELASTLRQLGPPKGDPRWPRLFVDAFPEREILAESRRLAASRSLYWTIYRARDRLRRGSRSKTAALLSLPTR